METNAIINTVQPGEGKVGAIGVDKRNAGPVAIIARQTNAIINAIQSGEGKVGEIGIDKRKAGLTAIIARLYSLKGMANTAVVKGQDGKDYLSPDVQLAIDEMEKEIALKYPFFTMSEVRYALEAGVKGELDNDPTFLTVVNFCKWLRKYRNSLERSEALQVIADGMGEDESAEAIEDLNAKAVSKALSEIEAEVRESGRIAPSHLDGMCASVYDWLRAQGRMERPDPVTGQAAMDEAVKAVKAMKRNGRESVAVADIIEGAMAQVKARAKRILLEKHLRAMCVTC